MKISVLLPTLNNTKGLSKSINSLIKNSKNKSKIEILLAINKNDFKTKKFIQSVNFKYKPKILFVDKGEGYFDAAERLNKLFKASSGDYLFCFNDDMIITTKNWDLKLIKYIQKLPKDQVIAMFPSHNQKNQHWPISPIISRKWCKLIGKFANVFEADTEIYILGKLLGRIYKLDNIRIHHKGGYKNKIKQKAWRETRWRLISKNFKHKKSIFSYKIFFVLKDYLILKTKIKSKIYFLEYLKLIIFFPFYLINIYKLTNINYFKIFWNNLSKKNFEKKSYK